MIKEFSDLSTTDQQILLDAIPNITVLIAAADGTIDKEEVEWAEKVANIRSYSNTPVLQSYYEAIDHTLDDKIKGIIEAHDNDTDKIKATASASLAQLNDVFPKLPTTFRSELYKSFLSFAKHVAEASGGFMGYMSIDGEEQDLMELPMITPVIDMI